MNSKYREAGFIHTRRVVRHHGFFWQSRQILEVERQRREALWRVQAIQFCCKQREGLSFIGTRVIIGKGRRADLLANVI